MRINLKKDHVFLPRIVNGSVYLQQKTSYMFCLNNFRKALKEVGVKVFMKFGEHSNKAGGLSEAANAGCLLHDLQIHGRWKSDSMPKMYCKRSLEARRTVSKVLNDL